MNRMKFYKELANGKIAVLEVRVDQSTAFHKGARRHSPAAAMDIAARQGFVCRRDFGDKRLATAKREGRVVPTQRTVLR